MAPVQQAQGRLFSWGGGIQHRISLCSPVCTETYSVDQAGRELHLLLPSEFRVKGMHHHGLARGDRSKWHSQTFKKFFYLLSAHQAPGSLGYGKQIKKKCASGLET